MTTREPITIIIEPPITEHCKHCGYSAHYSFYSHRCNCPECGKSLSRGEEVKEYSVTCSANYGSYDICNPSKKQWCYSFYNVPDMPRCSFVVDDEFDYSCPYNLVEELKICYDNYWVSSNKEKIQKLYDILMDEDFQEKNDAIERELKIKEHKRELYKLLQYR